MTTGGASVNPAVPWRAREHEPLRHEAESSQIEASLHGIQTSREALRLEAERRLDGAEDDGGPRGEKGRV